MKMSKRSRKLALSAGMLVAVASIPPAPPAEAACTLACPDGTVFTCTSSVCQSFPEHQEMYCGRLIYQCP
jgi:hypothetical protein